MSPLLQHLRTRIAAEGPLTVADYMAEALGHPEHGYYITRDPLGMAGDFTTAPEISQMFGELLGLWAAQVWLDLGRPAPLHLAEAGPGRGTLMADALRAMRGVPGLAAAVQVHLIETSPSLRARQQQTLAASGHVPVWHDRLETVPTNAPLLLLANEFLDALPIHQAQRGPEGWQERAVGWHQDRLSWTHRPPSPALAPLLPPADAVGLGKIIERCPAGLDFMRAIGQRLSQQGGAALLIDYGYAQPLAVGDTLQAVHKHRYADPLHQPGEADLTAHVDFHAMALAAQAAGARVFSPKRRATFCRPWGSPNGPQP